jgi:hypothetical protein
MSPNSAQRLASHVASSAGSAELNASDVILKAEEFQLAAVALHGRPNALNCVMDHY